MGTWEDIKLLLECLECQSEDPDSLQKTLETLSSICTNDKDGSVKNYLFDNGGLHYIWKQFGTSPYSQVKEAAHFTIACIVQKHAKAQRLFTTAEMFTSLYQNLSDPSWTMKQVSAYIIVTLASNNRAGQNMARKSKCLERLAILFKGCLKQIADFSKKSIEYNAALSFSNALCACLCNPQNDENQRLCAGIYPWINNCLQQTLNPDIIQPILSLMGASVCNNIFNQNCIRQCGVLNTLAMLLYKAFNRQNVPLAAQVINALDICVQNNGENSKCVSEMDVVSILLNLLKNSCEDQEVIHIAFLLRHCIETCGSNYTQFVEGDGVKLLVNLLHDCDNEDVNKALTYTLHTAVQNKGTAYMMTEKLESIKSRSMSSKLGSKKSVGHNDDAYIDETFKRLQSGVKQSKLRPEVGCPNVDYASSTASKQEQIIESLQTKLQQENAECKKLRKEAIILTKDKMNLECVLAVNTNIRKQSTEIEQKKLSKTPLNNQKSRPSVQDLNELTPKRPVQQETRVASIRKRSPIKVYDSDGFVKPMNAPKKSKSYNHVNQAGRFPKKCDVRLFAALSAGDDVVGEAFENDGTKPRKMAQDESGHLLPTKQLTSTYKVKAWLAQHSEDNVNLDLTLDKIDIDQQDKEIVVEDVDKASRGGRHISCTPVAPQSEVSSEFDAKLKLLAAKPIEVQQSILRGLSITPIKANGVQQFIFNGLPITPIKTAGVQQSILRGLSVITPIKAKNPSTTGRPTTGFVIPNTDMENTPVTVTHNQDMFVTPKKSVRTQRVIHSVKPISHYPVNNNNSTRNCWAPKSASVSRKISSFKVYEDAPLPGNDAVTENGYTCPWRQTPKLLNGHILNSRPMNIALETSPYTCQSNREDRQLMQHQIRKHKVKEPLKDIKNTLIRKPSGVMDANNGESPIKRKKRSMSVYDFNAGDSELDRKPSNKYIIKHRPNNSRRSRVDYTEQEITNLTEGVKRLGRFWNQILYTYKFHPTRTCVDLKDKYKQLRKQKKIRRASLA